MLNVTISVNGMVIHAIEVVNTGPSPLVAEPVRYTYRGMWFPMDHEERPRVYTGELTHARNEGADVLVLKVLEAMKR